MGRDLQLSAFEAVALRAGLGLGRRVGLMAILAHLVRRGRRPSLRQDGFCGVAVLAYGQCSGGGVRARVTTRALRVLCFRFRHICVTIGTASRAAERLAVWLVTLQARPGVRSDLRNLVAVLARSLAGTEHMRFVATGTSPVRLDGRGEDFSRLARVTSLAGLEHVLARVRLMTGLATTPMRRTGRAQTRDLSFVAANARLGVATVLMRVVTARAARMRVTGLGLVAVCAQGRLLPSVMWNVTRLALRMRLRLP